MNSLSFEKNYDRLKKFHRVRSLTEIFSKHFSSGFFEEETLKNIKENISNYKKKEQLRLNKLEFLTKLLEKIDLKINQNKILN